VDAMKVDVVIVAYGAPDDLDRCLDRVLGLDEVAGVTVVDNGDGGGAELATRRGTRALRLPSNPGFGTAVNHGAAEGDAEAILVLNPDARLDPVGLRAAIERLEVDPATAAAQGAIVNAVTGTEERSAGRELGVVHLFGRLVHARTLLRSPAVRAVSRRVPTLRDHVDRRPAAALEVETLAATAVVLRRSAFLAVGGFDPRYFLYGEDLDLCARLRASGWTLVTLPSSMAVHRSGASSRSPWDRELVWWQGTLQFARDHWHGGRRLAALLVGGAAGACLVARAPRRAGTVARALGGR